MERERCLVVFNGDYVESGLPCMSLAVAGGSGRCERREVGGAGHGLERVPQREKGEKKE